MQVLSGYVRDARLFDDHAGEPFCELKQKSPSLRLIINGATW
jgi:hypothetical protein